MLLAACAAHRGRRVSRPGAALAGQSTASHPGRQALCGRGDVHRPKLLLGVNACLRDGFAEYLCLVLHEYGMPKGDLHGDPHLGRRRWGKRRWGGLVCSIVSCGNDLVPRSNNRELVPVQISCRTNYASRSGIQTAAMTLVEGSEPRPLRRERLLVDPNQDRAKFLGGPEAAGTRLPPGRASTASSPTRRVTPKIGAGLYSNVVRVPA